MPRKIRINPAVISNFGVGKFFNLPPNLKPKRELINVTKMINSAGLRI